MSLRPGSPIAAAVVETAQPVRDGGCLAIVSKLESSAELRATDLGRKIILLAIDDAFAGVCNHESSGEGDEKGSEVHIEVGWWFR